MKVIAIAFVALLALIGGGVILVGGGAFFVASSIESRTAEIEKEMMAQLAADAPYELTPNQISLFQPQIKKLAELAAKMEFAQKLKDVEKGELASKADEIDTKMAIMSKAVANYDPSDRPTGSPWEQMDSGSDFNDADMEIGE